MDRREILIKYYEVFNEDDVVDYNEYLSYVNDYEEYLFDLIIVFYLGRVPFNYLDDYFRQGIAFIKMYEAHNFVLNMPFSDTVYLKIIDQLKLVLEEKSKKK